MVEMKVKLPVYMRLGDTEETEIGTVEYDLAKSGAEWLGDAKSTLAAALRAAADKVEES